MSLSEPSTFLQYRQHRQKVFDWLVPSSSDTKPVTSNRRLYDWVVLAGQRKLENVIVPESVQDALANTILLQDRICSTLDKFLGGHVENSVLHYSQRQLKRIQAYLCPTVALPNLESLEQLETSRDDLALGHDFLAATCFLLLDAEELQKQVETVWEHYQDGKADVFTAVLLTSLIVQYLATAEKQLAQLSFPTGLGSPQGFDVCIGYLWISLLVCTEGSGDLNDFSEVPTRVSVILQDTDRIRAWDYWTFSFEHQILQCTYEVLRQAHKCRRNPTEEHMKTAVQDREHLLPELQTLCTAAIKANMFRSKLTSASGAPVAMDGHLSRLYAAGAGGNPAPVDIGTAFLYRLHRTVGSLKPIGILLQQHTQLYLEHCAKVETSVFKAIRAHPKANTVQIWTTSWNKRPTAAYEQMLRKCCIDTKTDPAQHFFLVQFPLAIANTLCIANFTHQRFIIEEVVERLHRSTLLRTAHLYNMKKGQVVWPDQETLIKLQGDNIFHFGRPLRLSDINESMRLAEGVHLEVMSTDVDIDPFSPTSMRTFHEHVSKFKKREQELETRQTDVLPADWWEEHHKFRNAIGHRHELTMPRLIESIMLCSFQPPADADRVWELHHFRRMRILVAAAGSSNAASLLPPAFQQMEKLLRREVPGLLFSYVDLINQVYQHYDMLLSSHTKTSRESVPETLSCVTANWQQLCRALQVNLKLES